MNREYLLKTIYCLNFTLNTQYESIITKTKEIFENSTNEIVLY